VRTSTGGAASRRPRPPRTRWPPWSGRRRSGRPEAQRSPLALRAPRNAAFAPRSGRVPPAAPFRARAGSKRDDRKTDSASPAAASSARLIVLRSSRCCGACAKRAAGGTRPLLARTRHVRGAFAPAKSAGPPGLPDRRRPEHGGHRVRGGRGPSRGGRRPGPRWRTLAPLPESQRLLSRGGWRSRA